MSGPEMVGILENHRYKNPALLSKVTLLTNSLNFYGFF